ncbi:MAG: TetR/AcrR family transcriptional regulator [Coprobacillaceae bacterium]
MGSAFNKQERKIIIGKLKEAANEQIQTIGMRKTTVEELAKKASISKGAFYHFYPTKEHLFFDVLEDWHEEMLQVALETVRNNEELPMPKRIELTMLSIIEALERNNTLSFIENDMEILLRKLPKELLSNHFQDYSLLIKVVLQEANATPTVSFEVISGLVHSIFYTMAHRQEFGEHYQEVLRVLVESICKNIFTA